MELHLPGAQVVSIGSSAELAAALASLGSILPGEVIELKASEKHSIRAKRDDAYRIVTARRPGWWFRQTLTTGDSLDLSGRKPRPFWQPRGSLNDAKVLTVFREFFEGRTFRQPTEGA
ncbi:MAG: hypothetical protein ACKO1N_07500 [Erythrobacter sp.]